MAKNGLIDFYARVLDTQKLSCFLCPQEYLARQTIEMFGFGQYGFYKAICKIWLGRNVKWPGYFSVSGTLKEVELDAILKVSS